MLSISMIGAITLYLFPFKKEHSSKNLNELDNEKVFDFKKLRVRESFNENKEELEVINTGDNKLN